MDRYIQSLNLLLTIKDSKYIVNTLISHNLDSNKIKLIILELMKYIRDGENISFIKDIVETKKYLKNNKKYDNVKYKMQEFENFILNPFEVEEGVLICNKCDSNKTFSYTKQTRGGDESTTVFAICSQCDNRWKI